MIYLTHIFNRILWVQDDLILQLGDPDILLGQPEPPELLLQLLLVWLPFLSPNKSGHNSLKRKYFKEPNFYSSFHLTQVEDGVPESKLLIVHLGGRLTSAEVAVPVLGDLQVDLILVKNSEIC